MSMKRSLGTLALLAGVATMASPARAQETKGKFRFTIHGNYIEVSDEIRSNAANQTTEIDPTTGALVFLSDPRDDRAEGKAATIPDGPAYGFTVDYGLLRWKWGELLVEGNYNRFESEIKDLEVSGEFFLGDPDHPEINPLAYPNIKNDPTLPRFKTFPTKGGSLSWHNPQIGAKIRFRPTKAFAPYIGAGVGYYFVDFKQSSDVEELSANLQVSSGSYTVYDPRTFQTSFIVRRSGFRPVVVDAPDAFEYHLTGGVEYFFKKRYTIFLESRFAFTNGKVRITTDGREEFGQSYPDLPVPRGKTLPAFPPGLA